MNYSVTLKQLRDGGACYEGYNKVVCALKGKKFTDEIAEKERYIRYAHKEPIHLLSILESNGLEDALWCLKVIPGCDRDARLFAVWCVRQVQHLMSDQRSIDALDVAERFADGNATQEELAAAWDAARGAAWDAACGAACGAARAAARGAARGAAWDAAWDAARGAAWDAAWDAARAAARGAARVAAWDAARAAQKQMFIKMLNGEAPWQAKAIKEAA